MGVYIFVASVLAILILLTQNYWIEKDSTRERFKDLLNNLFLLVATFLGVVLAFYFTDREAAADKKEKTINILNLSYKALENYYSFVNLNGSHISKDNLLKGWKMNSIHPEILALKTPEIYYTISPYTYSDLLSADAAFTIYLREIEKDDSMKTEGFENMMKAINCWLWLTAKHIKLEISYQKGEIKEDSLHYLLNSDHIQHARGFDNCRCTTFPITDTSCLTFE